MNARAYRLSLALLFFILFICGANATATYWHLYHYIWWLDIPMHILGGIWLALSGLLCYYSSARTHTRDRSPHFVFAFAIAVSLTVGIGWEVYEWGVAKVVSVANDGVFDTLKDLCDDFIGALVAAGFFILKRYNISL